MLARALSACCAAAVLSGCSLLPLEPPELEVEHVALEKMRGPQEAAVFDVEIYNPNWRSLYISRADHSFYLNGDYIGVGIDQPGFFVPPRTEVVRPVQVFIKNRLTIDKLRVLFQGGREYYRIDSELYPGLPEGAQVQLRNTGFAELGHPRPRDEYDQPLYDGLGGPDAWCVQNCRQVNVRAPGEPERSLLFAPPP